MSEVSCQVNNEKAEESFNALKIGFDLSVEDALVGMIGMPDSRAKNYKMHKILYDNMLKYFRFWGDTTNYEIDPWDMVSKWETYFTRKTLRPLGRRTGMLPSRTLYGMNKRFEKIKKKTDDILSRPDQRMKNWERALYPPGLLMMSADRFGTVSKLIEAAQDITDKTIQSYAHYSAAMESTMDGFKINFDNMVSQGKIDMDNPIDGISGLYDSDGLPITIIKREKDKAGRTSYIVSYDDIIDEETEQNIQERLYPSQLSHEKQKGFFANIPSSLGFKTKYVEFTDEEYHNLVRSKYGEELVNDLLHGQTRYFIPVGVAERNERDTEIIKHALARRKERSTYAEEKNVDLSATDERTYKSADPDIQLSPDGLHEYLIIKQEVPSGGRETYTVHLLRAKDNATSDWQNVVYSDTHSNTIKKIIQQGYYKAQQEHTYGYRQGKGETARNSEGNWYIRNVNKRKEIKYQPYKAFGNYQYLQNQPEEAMMLDRTESTSEMNNVWDVVKEYRFQYENIYDDIRDFARRNNKDAIRVRQAIQVEMSKKINPATNKKYTEDEITQWIDENIHQLGGIESKIYEGKFGLSTSDSFFERIGDNYAPVIFDRHTLDIMMDDAILSLSDKLAGALDDETKAEYQKAKDRIEQISLLMVRRGISDWGEDIRQAASTVHTEHREQWTSNLKRRKDYNVHTEYLDKTFRNLHRNALINQMVSTMHKNMKLEEFMPTDITDYLVNRVKLTLGHKDTINRIPTLRGWNEVSNEEVANWMNTWFPKSLKGGRVFDEESAEKLFLTINGLFSGRFLGVGGAMGNRTQIVNPLIQYGFSTWNDAVKKLSGKRKDYWQGVVEGTGVLNLLNMFNEIMLDGGEVDFWDFGYYPFSDKVLKNIIGGSLPVPGQNMVHWAKLVTKGKDNFIKNGHFSVDRVLLKMLFREKSKLKRGEIAYLRELGGLLERFDTHEKWQEEYDGIDSITDPDLKAELYEKRDAYWSLLTTEKAENRRDVIEERMRRLIGDVADHKFKKMVTWKLSWWFGAKDKDLFTFTGGEQQMRSETALTAMLHSKNMGLLGGEQSSQDVYKTPAAKKIARDAVYQMMFGMSPVWLGEAFSGVGRSVMQYKSYTLFQMIHDSNIVQNFRDTNLSTGDAFVRLYKSLDSKSTDVESQAFMRLLGTRGVATMFGVLSSIAPIMWKIVGRSTGVSKIIRSAENPAFALAARMIVWSVLIGMGFSDEDEEKMREDWGNRLIFMLLPVLLGSIMRDSYDTITNFTD